MANCGNENESCASAPGSTMTEIYETEPCVRANLMKRMPMHISLSLCVHTVLYIWPQVAFGWKFPGLLYGTKHML